MYRDSERSSKGGGLVSNPRRAGGPRAEGPGVERFHLRMGRSRRLTRMVGAPSAHQGVVQDLLQRGQGSPAHNESTSEVVAAVVEQSYGRFIPGASGEEAPAASPARQEAEPVSVKST